jgi:hypothetical protein
MLLLEVCIANACNEVNTQACDHKCTHQVPYKRTVNLKVEHVSGALAMKFGGSRGSLVAGGLKAPDNAALTSLGTHPKVQDHSVMGAL